MRNVILVILPLCEWRGGCSAAAKQRKNLTVWKVLGCCLISSAAAAYFQSDFLHLPRVRLHYIVQPVRPPLLPLECSLLVGAIAGAVGLLLLVFSRQHLLCWAALYALTVADLTAGCLRRYAHCLVKRRRHNCFGVQTSSACCFQPVLLLPRPAVLSRPPPPGTSSVTEEMVSHLPPRRHRLAVTSSTWCC